MVSDYAQMDRVLREERAYILNLVKQVKKSGCNVLLIQKSILRYTHIVPHTLQTVHPLVHTHMTTRGVTIRVFIPKSV